MQYNHLGILLLTLYLTGTQGLTYYDYYAPSGGTISSGLVAEGDTFTLNGKNISIFSGAFHYFRVHPDYWRDTLKKLRSAGLNTLETYMAWNLHNPQKYVFDFGDGGNDMSIFLDVRRFVQMAQEEDLFVILRPGPYICSEWDFGGLPSWLLSDHTMSVRTSYNGYADSVAAYYAALSPQVADLSFMRGGPIIAVQIENEYGQFGYEDEPRDKLYLRFIHDQIVNNNMDDVLLLTSDSPKNTLDWGSLPGVLMTANFQTGVEDNLNTLKVLQPHRPLMVMEYWTGWFDHWLQEFHVVRDPDMINSNLDLILSMNSSVNFYMFIGGTNFGFMAGANKIELFPYYSPIVTSYDYDAPLTEEGDYSDKFWLIKDTLEKYNPLAGLVHHPAPPSERTKVAYGIFPIQESMSFQTLADRIPVKGEYSNGPVAMENFFFLNGGSGQSYGYALYTSYAELPAGNSTLLIRGHVRDMAQVMVNGIVVTKKYATQLDLNNFGFWNGLDKSLEFETPGGIAEIHILVENLGRVNYGVPHYFVQKKGLWEGPVLLNNLELKQWTVAPFEFKSSFINSLLGWKNFTASLTTPAAYRVVVPINTAPMDTFVDMSAWGKGVVFVNGFNLGRYWSEGPTKTLYLPAPFQKTGDNEPEEKIKRMQSSALGRTHSYFVHSINYKYAVKYGEVLKLTTHPVSEVVLTNVLYFFFLAFNILYCLT